MSDSQETVPSASEEEGDASYSSPTSSSSASSSRFSSSRRPSSSSSSRRYRSPSSSRGVASFTTTYDRADLVDTLEKHNRSSMAAPYTSSVLVTSSDATFWQQVTGLSNQPIQSGSPGVALAAAVAGVVLVLGVATALLLFAHYRRDSRLGKAWIRTQRSCAASCCGCCLGSARNGKSLEEEDDLPVPKIATSASTAKPKTPATPTHAERRAIEAGEGRAQVQRHMRSVSNASLRQSLGLALRPPPAQQGRTRKPLARAPTLESLSEMTEPPASARCSSVKSARKASAVEVPGDKRTSGGSHYENATEMPLSAGLRQASLDEKQTEAVV